MAKSQVQFTKDNEYYTPKTFVDFFAQKLPVKRFEYDPATTEDKAKDLGIPNFDDIKSDGLLQDWTLFDSIWINPPFTRKHEFLAKAWETYKKVKNDIYILFPIEFVTTARFHNSVGGGKLFIPNGRINFESGLGKKGKSPAFGSVVMKIQDTWEIEMIDIKNYK